MKLYELLIENKQKAIVGAIVAMAVSFFAQHGIDIEQMTVKEALETLLYGFVTWVAVYFKRNQGK